MFPPLPAQSFGQGILDTIGGAAEGCNEHATNPAHARTDTAKQNSQRAYFDSPVVVPLVTRLSTILDEAFAGNAAA